MTMSPTLGRWLEEDPIGFEGGDINLYRYESNGPTNTTDPWGLKDPRQGDNDRMGALTALLYPGPCPTKAQTFAFYKIPRLKLDNIPWLGGHEIKPWKVTRILGGYNWCGFPNRRQVVGPAGCGPCVGLILAPEVRGDKVYIFHFTANDDVKTTIEKLTRGCSLARYRAYICGAQASGRKEDAVVDREMEKTLYQVVAYLVEIKNVRPAYVPSPEVYVGWGPSPCWGPTKPTVNLTGH